VDREDDSRVGIKSTAILFGDSDLAVLRVLKLAMLGLLVWVGLKLGLTWPWYAAVAVAAGLFALQQWWVRGREPAACFRAFLNNNWVGLVLFAGLVAHYAWD
jgi:4-hydroxybenzoate polyprenyltransferase